LLVHFWTAVYLHSLYLPFPLAARDASVFAFDEPEPERMPDYHWDHVDSPDRVQDFERPLETPLPEAGEMPVLERRKPDRPVPLGKLTPLEPDDPHRRLPEPSAPKRAELPAPRRDELAAGAEISRQELKQTLDPGEPIPMPRVKPGGPAVVARPSAETIATRREEPALPEPSRAGAAPLPDARR
ncbi:MAG: hypothetical protein NUV77_17900, partial [Thermoguttaceae bacterium]|nr:hypothetical protein [Thermoguttaceae bacterium]